MLKALLMNSSQLKWWQNHRHHAQNQIQKWYTYSRFLRGCDVVCAVVWSSVALKPLPATTRLSPAANDSRSRCCCKQRSMGELLISLARSLFFFSPTRPLLLSHMCTFTLKHSFNLVFAFQFSYPAKNLSPLGLNSHHYLLKSPM